MKRIYLIDCPGIVPPSMTDSPEEVLLRGSVQVEKVENPAQYIPAVLAKCKRHHIERTYNIKGWESGESNDEAAKTDKQRIDEAVKFLEILARKGGKLIKGGEADLDGVAKTVLNDFLRGRIPWFSPPPATEGAEADAEAGRDEKLGITGKKRKRDLEQEVGDEAHDGTVIGHAGSEGEVEVEVSDDGDDDGFEGFDEDEHEDDEDSDGPDEVAEAGGVVVEAAAA